ncbi:hypothetical protein GCM10011404_12960 [Sphingomonas prati]|uniref:Membrane protein 6-pyruvoyl-tetrahydropterin synthase-related domain-containing protein n=2 Tax=Sphingomonas TaxID=13687 RepID=A0A7W9BPU6_9SPHN|nr:hypothetical protein [Sphingomonas prati]GGE81707.1 hypothetical protein GCM10011404_12960 [Sphingomonas prati]
MIPRTAPLDIPRGPLRPILWLWPFALALLLAVPVLRSAPLVQDSFWIDYVWAQRFHAALANGTVYPRWLDGSFGGLGAPVFYFYAPLSFYAVAFVMALGLPAYPALIATFILLHAASGLTMRRWLGGHGVAPNAGALLYMLLPYHLIDFHRRGALAEFAAFALLPLVARAVCRAGDQRGIAGLAVSYAALVMTHLPTALLASLLLILPLALHPACRPRLPTIAAGLLLGLALASVYLLPALLLQRHVDMAFLWRQPGLTPAAWSLLAPDRWVSPAAGMVFASLEIALAVAAVGLWRSTARFWPAVTLFACLVAANMVPGFWALPLLAKVQFPWRALTIAEFALATAFAGAIASGAGHIRSLWLVPALALAVPIVTTPFAAGHPTLAELDRDAPDVPEYLPAAGPIRSSIAAEALARHTPDITTRAGLQTSRRFWFPGVLARCAGGLVPTSVDPATGLVRHPAGPRCLLSTGLTTVEQIGWAVSACAVLLCLLLTTCTLRRAGALKPRSQDEGAIPMVDLTQIKEHANVIGADGVHVGTVDHLDGDRIKLTKNDSGDGKHHYIATGLVAEVEGNDVRLSANADVAISIFEESE